MLLSKIRVITRLKECIFGNVYIAHFAEHLLSVNEPFLVPVPHALHPLPEYSGIDN